ncbi:MAG TPA: hypothetical protein VLQ29_08200 [Candidatus Dormibacteraeota bacterium]|nr:hypothetical protein [Candidatus Dormibacteraeota bacterium]
MQRYLAVALVITTCPGATVFGQNVSRLYPEKTQQADAARWSEQIQAEYRDTILPQLTDEERSALGTVKIAVPLSGPNGDPFSFYTDDKGTIYLPALSLRFFSDLCVANAWLNAHGYDGTTVRDYVGVLLREATLSPGAPLPAVFRTLGIPDNAREESAVANRVDRNFGNTIVFLLAHELGHALKKHDTHSRDPVQKRRQEIEADAFAIEVMRRIGQVPLGVEFWFDVERIGHVQGIRRVTSARFPTEAEWQKYLAGLDHPVTSERLDALATAVEKAPDSFARNQADQARWTRNSKIFAQYMRLGAPSAAIGAARVAEYERVRDLHLEDLKPRKAAFTMPGSEQEPPFNGLFAVRRTAAGGGQDRMDLLLLRMGDDITGGYSNGKIDGFIQGDIRNGVLHFTWREGNANGHGVAQAQGETLRGTWGLGESEQGAGEFSAERQKKERKAP